MGTDWAVRRRYLRPSSWWAGLVRRASAPVMRPLQRRLHRAGANPADGPLWLLGVVVVSGLLVLAAVRWVAGSVLLFHAMHDAGPRAWIALGVSAVFTLVMTAIIVRVIGSWLGAGRYTAWMRPVYLSTDWIIQPIARRLPATGSIDFSPFVAYLGLMLLRGLLVGAIT